MNGELVSVIVPVYNVEGYLERCINSLTNQTYKNIEILLVEDGSKDSSLALCHSLAQKDRRIKVLFSSLFVGKKENVNNGLEVTRNCGLVNATGKYIMFLDSDDTYVFTAIEHMVEFIEARDVDIVFAPYIKILNDHSEILKAQMEAGVYSKESFAKYCFKEVPAYIISCIGNKIYKRSLIEENQIRFNSYYRYNEDAAFILGALNSAKKIGYIDFPFYNYHIRTSGSIQTSYRQDMFDNLIRTYELYKQFFLSNNVFEYVKKRYFKIITNIAFGSLYNEAVFSNYKQFATVFKQIKKSHHYCDMISVFKDVSVGAKMMLCCLQIGAPKILYAIIRTKNKVKARKNK